MQPILFHMHLGFVRALYRTTRKSFTIGTIYATTLRLEENILAGFLVYPSQQPLTYNFGFQWNQNQSLPRSILVKSYIYVPHVFSLNLYLLHLYFKVGACMPLSQLLLLMKNMWMNLPIWCFWWHYLNRIQVQILSEKKEFQYSVSSSFPHGVSFVSSLLSNAPMLQPSFSAFLSYSSPTLCNRPTFFFFTVKR